MTAPPPAEVPPRAHEIAILGNDVLLAALPARPVQVVHALQACGYELVIPLSWGEELLAEYTLKRLGEAAGRSLVFSGCPLVRKRLLRSGADLASHLLSVVPPPVATALYLRALQPDEPVRVTFFGQCEGAKHPSIDARVAPMDLLRHLEVSGIDLASQPTVFEGVVPPDRRRHFSLPGGLPSGDMVERHQPGYRLVALDGLDLTAELADRLIGGDSVLIDLTSAVGCACAGMGMGQGGGRQASLTAIEPPRSATPVLHSQVDPGLPLVGATGWGEGHARPQLSDAAGDPIPPPDGIHSISLARKRAERRRIAVTPVEVAAAGIEATPRHVPAAASTLTQRTGGPARAGVPLEGSERLDAAPTPPATQTPAREAAPAQVDGMEQGPAFDSASSDRGTAPAKDGSAESSPDVDRELPRPPRGARSWGLARSTTPPRARLDIGVLPRAYAPRRRRTPPEALPGIAAPPIAVNGGSLTSPIAAGDSPLVAAGPLDVPTPPGWEHEGLVADSAPSLPALLEPTVEDIAPTPGAATNEEARKTGRVPAGHPGATPPEAPGSPVADVGENRRAVDAIPLVITPFGVGTDPSDVNEYVTVKQRMAQRRLHSRPRRAPARPQSEQVSPWRLVAYGAVLIALAIAALLVYRR